MPALIEVPSPGAASSVMLRTSGAAPVNAQLRIFRWVQENGVERLEQTRDVVASPPQLQIQPGTDFLVRIVRVTKRPVAREESYRLVIDQLPDSSRAGQVAVKLLVRHVIPVFFADPASGGGALAWNVRKSGADVTVTATNAGGRRERISAMTLKDEAGRTVSFGDGLVGYVLGGSTMSWTSKGGPANFARSGAARISAQGYGGAINARATIAARD